MSLDKVTPSMVRGERPHLWDFIPPQEHAAMEARTSDYDASDDIDNMFTEIAPDTSNGDHVDMPKADIPIGRTIEIPNYCSFVGRGGRTSRFKVLPEFNEGDFAFTLGPLVPSQATVFDCRMQGVGVMLENRANGLYSASAQEQCGAWDCVFGSYKTYGMVFEHDGGSLKTAQNYFFDHLELFPSDNETIDLASVTVAGGVATCDTGGGDHNLVVGQKIGHYIALSGQLNDINYPLVGCFIVTSVPTPSTYTVAVGPNAVTATKTVKMSPQIGIYISGGGSYIRGGSNLSIVGRGSGGRGLGIVVDRGRAYFSRVHAERMAAAVVFGPEGASPGSEITSLDAAPGCGIGVQVGAVNGPNGNVVSIGSVRINDSSRCAPLWMGLSDVYSAGDALPGIWLGGGSEGSTQAVISGALGVPSKFRDGLEIINSSPFKLAAVQLGALPSASVANQHFWVNNLTGGAGPVYSDGTNWRRYSDGTVAN